MFVDARGDDLMARRVAEPEFVRRVCTPHTGVGADGLAIVQTSTTQDFKLTYINRDGSVGELCGNASLCATRLAVELGIAQGSGLTFATDAGVMQGRMREGQPEVDLRPPTALRPDAGISKLFGELGLGFVNTGVPHLVVRADDASLVDLGSRGPELRYHESLPAGANVNWVSPTPDGAWRMRTYERGVEAETLACGTGAVACAVMLSTWGEAGDVTRLQTRSGRTLTVTIRQTVEGIRPSLAGEARIVFEGVLREI
ncbi:MAG: diaminopimelate epimerase [Gemmatimonadetes bacterium]|nr:diaminopimelate epimerase [Gemmatimonadota bacterium]